MAEIIKGTDVAAWLREDLKKTIENNRISPCLGIVRVGNNESDLAYERGVLKTCEKVGIKAKVFEIPADISQEGLESEFSKVNDSDEIDGILLFRPLPKGLDEKPLINMIDPEKDMDCMCPANWSKLAMGDTSGYCPCTAEAVMKILEFAGVKTEGANAVILGRSQVIGKPLGLMLLGKNASVTWCHSKTKDIPERCKNADILVSACGKADMVGEKIASVLAPGSCAIDVGMNFVDGRMCGDFTFDAVEKYVSKITPVPGGVGSVTNTIMASHVVRAALKKASK